MAVVEEDSDNKTHHSHQISTSTSIPMNNNYPNLFNKFMSSENQRRRRNLPLPTVKPIQQPFHVEEIDEEELELSLGLSMNGRFGVDPNAKKIKRTSSIPEFMIPVSEEETGHVIPAVVNGGGLIRTCSLPVESEEEWRKRKELQSIRRMEARRKRNEKQRNLRGMRERININVVGFEGGVVIEGGGVNSNNNLVDQGDDGLRRTTSLLRSRVGGIDLNCEKESPPQQGGSGSGSGGGSIGSYHGTGSSSGTSESEGQQHGQDEQKSPISAGARVAKNLGPQNKTKDSVKNLLEDMPSVSTKGEGPNGKRIQGFLYKYGKGEEVRILCVCHGSFLTPAEFVKHAGGPDVTNPLKHIVVSSNLN